MPVRLEGALLLDGLDIFLSVCLGYAAWRGYSKGLLGTAAGYVAPVLGVMAAGDFSDPVRDRIAASVPLPDFVLGLLAPFVTFLMVVVALRTAAALLSKVLGLGLSLPSRLVASGAGLAVTAVLLGAGIVLVHEFVPKEPHDPDDEGAAVAAPVEEFLRDVDTRFAQSLLGPPLSALATSVLREAEKTDREAVPEQFRRFLPAKNDAASAPADASRASSGDARPSAARAPGTRHDP